MNVISTLLVDEPQPFKLHFTGKEFKENNTFSKQLDGIDDDDNIWLVCVPVVLKKNVTVYPSELDKSTSYIGLLDS